MMAFLDMLPSLSLPPASAFQGLFGVLLQLALFVAAAVIVYKQRALLTIQRPSTWSSMWGFVAIPQGERWNLCTTSGELLTIDGPKVVRVWGARLLQLDQICASHAQYLWVQFVDGRTQIIPGPAMVYVDKSIHKEVKVHKATTLTEHEVLVVYRDEEEKEQKSTSGSAVAEGGHAVTRHVIRGPCLHTPKNASEWVHDFCWHGSLSNDPDTGGRKSKNALKFSKLRVCPEQTYFDIEGVRTRDDALVSVKVMIFYRLNNIETMLRETHDPIADFINAISSDAIEFVAAKSFEEFKITTEKLNELDTYPLLITRAAGIGFEVTKVVFRGYGAPPRLQKMHDDAIDRRTKLALEREIEEQEQQLKDIRLDREEQRERRRHKMEVETKAHERELQKAEHDAQMNEKLTERQAQLTHLASLKRDTGISGEELASYILAMEQGPPEKLIQITGRQEGSRAGSFVQLTQEA